MVSGLKLLQNTLRRAVNANLLWKKNSKWNHGPRGWRLKRQERKGKDIWIARQLNHDSVGRFGCYWCSTLINHDNCLRLRHFFIKLNGPRFFSRFVFLFKFLHVIITSESLGDITCDSLGDVTWSHGTHDVRDLSGRSDRSRMGKSHQKGQNCDYAGQVCERVFTRAISNK